MHDSIKTFFEGVHKVCPPAQTCKTALAALERFEPRILERYTEIVHPSGVPHYRIHGTAAYRRVVGTWRASGKGHSSEQALASGLMELIERYSCYTYLSEAPGAMHAARSSLDGEAMTFEEFASCFYRRHAHPVLSPSELVDLPLTWFRARSLDDRPVAIPARLVTYVLEGSNGMASGNTVEEALLHGLLEVLERHCQTHVTLGRRVTPRIDPGTIDSALTRDLLDRFAAGGEHMIIRDFSQGMRLPIIAAARRLEDGRAQVTVGSATTREEAALRALTENVQTEGLMNCYKPEDSAHYLDETEEPVPFDSVEDIDDVNIRNEIDAVAAILSAHGMRAAYADTTREDLGIPAIMCWIFGAQFHAEQTAQRSLLTGFLYDAQSGGDRQLTRDYAELCRERDTANRPVADLALALDRAADGELVEARRCLRSVAGDPRSLHESEVLSLSLLRDEALAHIATALGDDDAAQEACLAVIVADETVTADFVALTPPIGVSADAAAKTAALFGELRQFWLLAGRPAAHALLDAYRAFLTSRAALEVDLATAEQLFGEGRDEEALARARTALERDRLGAEFLQVRWLTGRCLARLGRWDEALAELESMQGLQYDDPRFVMLLELCRKKADTAT